MLVYRKLTNYILIQHLHVVRDKWNALTSYILLRIQLCYNNIMQLSALDHSPWCRPCPSVDDHARALLFFRTSSIIAQLVIRNTINIQHDIIMSARFVINFYCWWYSTKQGRDTVAAGIPQWVYEVLCGVGDLLFGIVNDTFTPKVVFLDGP